MITRRALGIAGIGFIAQTLLPMKASVAIGSANNQQRRDILKFTRLFETTASAAIIGTAYLQTAPWEADADRLLNRLMKAIGWPDQLPDHAMLQKHLNAARIKDFETGDVAFVRGWILSVTEARLCALTLFSRSLSMGS